MAAVAMVGFSAAFQPAAASPIVIDDFTLVLSATATGGSAEGTVLAGEQDGGTFGPFDKRELNARWTQNTVRAPRTVSAISTGSSGRLQLITSVTSSGSTPSNGAQSSFRYSLEDASSVDLTTSGNAFQIQTLATVPAPGFEGYLTVIFGDDSDTWNSGSSIPSLFPAPRPTM
jgi:hypothetical protein